jgi:prolyl-tRNA synthetase
MIVPEMGSYGIGVSRLVGALVEANHDDDGIMWPDTVAPFQVALIQAKTGDTTADALCQTLYEKLTNAHITVLWDDRLERPGTKFADIDLIGLPHHFIIGNKALQDGVVEYKNRRTGGRELIPISGVENWIQSNLKK